MPEETASATGAAWQELFSQSGQNISGISNLIAQLSRKLSHSGPLRKP
jgi:hypothetical protein